MMSTKIDHDQLAEVSGRFIADGLTPGEADLRAVDVITEAMRRTEPKPETIAEIIARHADDARTLERTIPEKAKTRPATEAGLAEAFADVFADRLLFIHELKSWHSYDGRRWLMDQHGLATQAAKILVRALTVSAISRGEGERVKKLIGFERAARLSAILSLASTEPRLVRPLSDFDADPFTFNTPGGLVDLRTGEIVPHDSRQFVTKLAGASPDFEAPAPMFEQFMREITDDRRELAEWIIARMGYTLTADTSLQDFEVRIGTGANGKGVLQKLQLAIWGDYAGSVDPAILLSADKRRGGPNAELLDTRGRRVIFATETAEGDRLDSSRVKTLTGEDEQAARALFSNFVVRFTPTAKIVLSTNAAPGLDAVDFAMRRRVRLIPFDRTFAGLARNPRIVEELLMEKDAILGLIVRAATAYAQTQALPPCEIIDAASGDFVDAQDPIVRWIEERCRRREDALSNASVLYSDFRSWQEADGMRNPWTQTRFGRGLESHGFPSERKEAGKYRRGLELSAAF